MSLRTFRYGFCFTALLALSACNDDPVEPLDIDKLAAEMSQRVVATSNYDKRGDLVPRYNQPKTIACLTGEFTVAEQIPDHLKHGLFANPGTYPVTARFASASKWDDSEKDIRGVSLRINNVAGQPIWGKPGFQDFLFNSYPALFVATPEEFLDFMRARQTGSKLSLVKFFLSPFNPHIKSLMTVLKARKKHMSPLDIRYWSTVPSALDGQLQADSLPSSDTLAVKYSVTPCSTYTTESVVEKGENQLRTAVRAHLNQAPACFDFGLQTQIDPDTMPIEDASVIWNEEQSPFITVARVSFADQNFDDPGKLAECEQTQFNPWQSLPAHKPLGRMNAVRKAVYATGAYQRENQ